MANSVSSNTNLYSTASSRRITGLATGLDTDSIVKNMIATQQSRLDKALQQKTLIGWQKESYRTAINMMTEFQGKFLDVLNPSSIMRSSSLKALTTNIPESASKYLSVTSSNDSLNSTLKINKISQLATNQKVESSSQNSALAVQFNTYDNKISALAGKSFSVTLDGTTTKVISFESDITKYNDTREVDDGAGGFTTETFLSIDKVKADLQRKIDDAFGKKADGTSKLNLNLEQNLEMDGKPAGYAMKFEASAGSTIKLAGSNIGDSMVFLGKMTNYTDTTKTIGALFGSDSGNPLKTDAEGTVKFSINEVDFTFSKNSTMNDVMTRINQSAAGVKISYSTLSDKFTLTANETGSGNNIRIKDLSSSGSDTNFLAKVFGTSDNNGETVYGNVINGQDAVFTVDNIEIVRSNNSFSINGYDINLLSATPAETADMNIDISTKIDATKTMQTIKDFVNGYNDLLTGLNGMLKEKRSKIYIPLTDTKKEEMSDKEIENWEAAAKKGLLTNDPTISRMVTNLRTALSSAVNFSDGSGKTLASIGITTNKVGVDLSGKLVIDEKKLKDAIENDPESVVKLFTNLSDIPKGEKINSTNSASYAARGIKTDADLAKARFNSQGLAQRFAEIFNNNISTTYLSEGSLIKIAGTNGKNAMIDINSRLGLKETTMDTTIAKIQKKLYDDQDRAYAKMAALEKAIARMNEQSTNLFSQ